MRVVIVGAGKVGYILTQYLSREDYEVIVIENNDERRAIARASSMIIAGTGLEPFDAMSAVAATLCL